ncbi:hypothetical protein BG842_11115 [Haladaptatus sp. W1]|nr:hypothetical protein BG842_11115 [Haladaptatus sp. W1]
METRASNLEPRGAVGVVRADVDAEFALRAFHRAVRLRVHRRFERPGDVRLQGALLLGPVVEQFDALLDDSGRLLDLPESDEDTSVVVTAVLGYDVPVELVVVTVGVVAAQVVVDARPAGDRSGDAVLFRHVGFEDAGIDATELEYLVAREEVVILLHRRREAVDEIERLVEELPPRLRNVPDDPAEAEVVVHHALAGQVLQDVLDDFAVPERVLEDGGEVAVHVEREGPEREEVAGHAREFDAERPEDLSVLRHVDVREVLGRPRVRPLVGHVRGVIPAVGVRHDFVPVFSRLRHLLLAAVEVADVGANVQHLLAVEDGFDVEDAVGRRVVRPDVEKHRVGVVRVLVVFYRVSVGLQRDDLRTVLVVVEGKRVALPRLRKENPAQVGVPLVLDTHEVVGLTLVPLRGSVDGFRGLAHGRVGRRGDDDTHLLGWVGVLFQVIDALEAVLVLLGRQTREVVEPGLVPERRQGGLHFVGPNDESRRVQVVVAADGEVAEEFGQFVRLQFLHRRKAFFSLRTHGESTQL